MYISRIKNIYQIIVKQYNLDRRFMLTTTVENPLFIMYNIPCVFYYFIWPNEFFTEWACLYV
jgi:hypothetical protein